ncbi:MAG: cytochrome c peroxidase [Saprospiraceae bacterium]|nr:cytochrome c peroxidase [Saprospiraceae bacterium]
MKKYLIFAFGLILGVFFLSNINYDSPSSFVMTVVSEIPELPENPYDYSNIPLPDHLFVTDDDIGYGRGGLDTLSFAGITDHGATLGRVLFYDKKLSAVENISCGSCHHQELSFTENKAFSEGVNNLTHRNSMHLNDLAWTNDAQFVWSMKETDLHSMIILPLTDENEIGADIHDVKVKLEATEYYPQLFENAYGDSEITEERIVDALVQFIESMTTFESKFDQGVKTNFEGFTETEALGVELFSENCARCHVQGKHLLFDIIFLPGNEMLQIEPFLFNNGLEQNEDDLGAGEWDANFEYLFKIPTLRNIELTGPYMHDGRFVTLEEVIDHYSEGIVQNNYTNELLPGTGFGFTDVEKSALVDFLKTLTDETFITNPKWSDPFSIFNSTTSTLTESLKLYPNPMTDQAVIKFANPGNDLVSISILTQDGRLVKHDRINQNKYILNKSDFHAGIYFVQIIKGTDKSTQKLIIN